jgi:hypothetical protein
VDQHDEPTKKLLINTLKMERNNTKKVADHLALKPTTTMIQAINPIIETINLVYDHSP